MPRQLTMCLFLFVVGWLALTPRLRAQENCVPPELHGLRIGMTLKEARAVTQYLHIPRADRYHVRFASQYLPYKRRAEMAGVFSVELWFVEDKLARLHLQYEGPEDASAIRGFVEQVRDTYHLPIGQESKADTCLCSGVAIAVARENRRTIWLTNTATEPLLLRLVEESLPK